MYVVYIVFSHLFKRNYQDGDDIREILKCLHDFVH